MSMTKAISYWLLVGTVLVLLGTVLLGTYRAIRTELASVRQTWSEIVERGRP